MDMHMIGDMSTFGLGYTFYDDVHATEIALYLNGTNILGFTSEGKHLTTRWDLDELAEWMREFIANMQDEPYPVQASGEYAAAKDEAAREFDTDDEEEFDRYYDLIDEWVWRHTWHHASSGAILANVYFQQIGDRVEISWNNSSCEDGVSFDCVLGVGYVEKDSFLQIMNQFLVEYATHWFSEAVSE